MSLKAELLPTGRNRVIDLVRAAGVDVSDWGNYKGGPLKAATNPKYCYEWSFVQPGKVVILNLWHANLIERDSTVSVTTNMRADAERLARMKAKAVWIKRAHKMDEAIAVAAADQLPVRVILNDGERRDATLPQGKASSVRSRMLDPMPWAVAEYSTKTGHALIVRGGAMLRTIDQFDLPDTETLAPPTRLTSVTIFARDPRVRAAVLARAQGKCEFCSRPGFVTSSGSFYLETHHIVPLSEGGADVVTNVAALCPNHHREAHHGEMAEVVRDYLLDIASR